MLKELDIAGSGITNKGAMEIAELLKSNTTLTYLNISKNWIDKEGLMSILVAAKRFRSLQRLDCIFNTLSQSNFIRIIDYDKRKCSQDVDCFIQLYYLVTPWVNY